MPPLGPGISGCRPASSTTCDRIPGGSDDAHARIPAASSGGSFNHEGMSNAGTTTITASFFDPEPDVKFKLPFEFKTGAAWIGSRAQVEVDLLTYTGRSPYQGLQTSESWTIITDPGNGGTPAVQHLPLERP